MSQPIETRRLEKIKWFDPKTGHSHTIFEEGYLFRWIAKSWDEDGKEIVYDFGLVPGGAFVSVLNLVESKRHFEQLANTEDDTDHLTASISPAHI